MSEEKDIRDLRGISDPCFFSFSVLKDKIHTMVGHGICFVSMEMHSNTVIDLGAMMEDPRFRELVKFIKSNYLKQLEERISKLEKINEPKPNK